MTSSRRTRRLGALLGTALGAATVLAGFSPPAEAQAPVIRNQTRIINQAITNQVRQALRPRLLIRDSAGPVSIMETGSGGRFLAVASADGGVRVWDLETGRQIQRLQAGALRAVAIDEANRRLATAGADGNLILWDIASGQEVRRLPGHAGAVSSVRFSPDGTLLASAGADGTVRLWNTITGQALATLTGHAGAVNALAFAPTGTQLASGGADGTVRLWSVPDGRASASLTGSEGAVQALAFTADGTLYGGDATGSVQAWRAGTPAAQRRFRAVGGAVTGLALRPDGMLAVASGGQRLGVWNGADGRRVAEVENPEGTVVATVFAGDRVVGAGSDGRARLWDAAAGTLAAQLIMTRGGWTVLDAAGRFDGSDSGLGDVAWQADQEVLEMTNFSQPYYEPGLLAKTLRAPGALLTPAAAPITAGIAPPPLVQLAAASGSQAAVPGPTQVTVTASDRGGGITEVLLYANGKALDPDRVASTEDVTVNNLPSRRVTYNVDLVAGSNRLRAVALGDNRIESVPAETVVTVQAPVAAPTLHVVAVGINQYSNPALTLNYAVADARGLTSWARTQNGSGTFGKVVLHELYDRQATRANINALFAKLKDTQPQDVVVLYIAGHGENAESNWYFLPTEFGRNLPFETAAGDARSGASFRQAVLQAVASDGISARTFHQNVVRIGAQRILVLIDACKSGGVKRAFEADADRRTLALLSQQAGVHILAATDKEQLAVELASLGHGAFTYAVLNGLGGVADTGPRDGTVSAREVLGYATAQVPSLALRHGQSEQNPSAFSRGGDFTVSRPAKGGAGNAEGGKRKKS
ncbi:caspase family protein [Azospirillum sp. SYSU D00513]|uniref:WD40 domain-containing protein n=1 Tax=Azospirillum sp. SYSU D00513 TaxID=2812561 RepID=UPI001A95E0B4|nr:caspase family protein [Azospirillum sp. SYSU D00513]